MRFNYLKLISNGINKKIAFEKMQFQFEFGINKTEYNPSRAYTLILKEATASQDPFSF